MLPVNVHPENSRRKPQRGGDALPVVFIGRWNFIGVHFIRMFEALFKEEEKIMSERKFANPGPWGVTAFATTSFMLGIYNAGLLPHGGMMMVMNMALVFGGGCQVICAILEFVAGNTFTCSVFGVFGPLWITLGLFELYFAKLIPPAAIPSAVALYLAMFAVVTFYFFIATLKTDWMLIIILALIDITLVVLAIGAGTGIAFWTILGGWITMVFAVLAWYYAAAGIIAFTFGREVLPLGKIKPAAQPAKAMA